MSDTPLNFPHTDPFASADVQARQPDVVRAADAPSAEEGERHEGFEWPVPPIPVTHATRPSTITNRATSWVSMAVSCTGA